MVLAKFTRDKSAHATGGIGGNGGNAGLLIGNGGAGAPEGWVAPTALGTSGFAAGKGGAGGIAEADATGGSLTGGRGGLSGQGGVGGLGGGGGKAASAAMAAQAGR